MYLDMHSSSNGTWGEDISTYQVVNVWGSLFLKHVPEMNAAVQTVVVSVLFCGCSCSPPSYWLILLLGDENSFLHHSLVEEPPVLEAESPMHLLLGLGENPCLKALRASATRQNI